MTISPTQAGPITSAFTPVLQPAVYVFYKATRHPDWQWFYLSNSHRASSLNLGVVKIDDRLGILEKPAVSLQWLSVQRRPSSPQTNAENASLD